MWDLRASYLGLLAIVTSFFTLVDTQSKSCDIGRETINPF